MPDIYIHNILNIDLTVLVHSGDKWMHIFLKCAFPISQSHKFS